MIEEVEDLDSNYVQFLVTMRHTDQSVDLSE